ncbi:MAG: DUF3842 family protein [Erysipelotrichaceae bacterium]|jgi:hypothetical protein|nr:DUF3842 family protein [Erysipelotrichaceae bacterium]
MNILVIDAQGGGIGRQLISEIKSRRKDLIIHAVGTNSAASQNMLKAGADLCATGENAVITACRDADVIIGPIGIAIADSMLGEVTPKMAKAIGRSKARRILIPFQHCGSVIVGVSETNTGRLINEAVNRLLENL